MSEAWPSPAKLNLFLAITGRRPDGYHTLQTLFQFLDYGDTLWFTPLAEAQLALSASLPGVPDEQNLVLRAARLLQHQAQHDRRLGRWQGARITLQKRLPAGGGLGGGSSNAATTLIALNHYWQTGYTLRELAELGLRLGADVPVFVHGHAAFAEGVGEILTPASPPEKWYLVAHPGIAIATAAVFADPDLPRHRPPRSLADYLAAPLYNDCEAVVRKRFPKVEQLLTWLLEYAPSRLTGTGACVFAEFASEAAARQVLANVPDGVCAFVARGVNRSPLHAHLKLHSAAGAAIADGR